MPQTLSAKRTLRVSKRREAVNDLIRQKIKKALSAARKKASIENVRIATSVLDRAAKKNVIKAEKAAKEKKHLFWLLTKSDKVGYTKGSKIKHAQKPNKPATSRGIRKKAAR